MTKQEILNETQNLVQTYLGIPCGISGKGWSKERLFARQQAYVKMVWIQQEANQTVKQYSDDQKLYFAISGETPKDLQSAYTLLREAQAIWHTSF